MIDPIEAIIIEALSDADIAFTREERNAGRPARPDDVTLDFHLTDLNIYIEVKQFHSDRIADQMAQAPNVIAIQGRKAAEFFSQVVRRSSRMGEDY